jgi:selenide,water dikinase
VLERVLTGIKPVSDPNVLVGFENADDGGVYRLNDEMAIVQTIDFFTPVVDDPHTYGQIAAANALSDIYAMGGKPLFALSVVGFPEGTVGEDVLHAIVRGGTEKMNEAGVPVIGGHSVQDPEMKFGYCVTGVVEPRKLLTNGAAQPGDILVLTKPLGTGIIATGLKFGKASEDQINAAVRVMVELNRESAETLQKHGAHSATDITGYGFIGHAYEMAKASKATFVIDSDAVPLIEGTAELARKRMLPGGIMTNEAYVGNAASWEGISDQQKQILLDPQTSGGLLASVPGETGEDLLADLRVAGVNGYCVGRVLPLEDYLIRFVGAGD